MGVEHEVVASETEERITLEVKGPETGLVIGKKGQTLDSLQYLVNKIVSKKLGEGEGKPITVDAEGLSRAARRGARRAGAQAGGEGQAHRAAGGGRSDERGRSAHHPRDAGGDAGADDALGRRRDLSPPGRDPDARRRRWRRRVAPDSRDTIAAIATAVGGGIGIVRLSGPRAGEILGEAGAAVAGQAAVAQAAAHGRVRSARRASASTRCSRW